MAVPLRDATQYFAQLKERRGFQEEWQMLRRMRAAL